MAAVGLGSCFTLVKILSQLLQLMEKNTQYNETFIKTIRQNKRAFIFKWKIVFVILQIVHVILYILYIMEASGQLLPSVLSSKLHMMYLVYWERQKKNTNQSQSVNEQRVREVFFVCFFYRKHKNNLHSSLTWNPVRPPPQALWELQFWSVMLCLCTGGIHFSLCGSAGQKCFRSIKMQDTYLQSR